ncbi:MBOAT family O-acyltransferase [Hymenobacter sp. H14-R3]|uniref:MBOAT family O-acyltransferase n=1 Tax=Hymenobacter sp. H14-R3 TaxID=3046308 RepID=UPI0024BB81ED|nr:MBOAT family O-acyltransferase [Hymenobacter sp. H14-R3]MDJ0366883.1 MBOAT family O-acyltransferase [Hymenobacter sp. H14-R3]
MLFNSLHFLVFFPVAIGLYFGVPARGRAPLLLATSYYFYLSWQPAYGLLLAGTTLLDYFSGVRMSRLATKPARRPWLYLSLASNLGTLFIFKYFNFFAAAAGELAALLHAPFMGPTLALALPVGVSFYTFQSVAYIVDVYQGKLPAEQNLGRFALFVAFWPQLVAGPIERGSQMLPQLRARHAFDYGRVASGLRLMAWGMFKKVVIADRLALLANPVFDHPHRFAGLPLLLAVAAFTGQIYADFSGYTDLARGTARVLGYHLVLNFRQPYLATSVGDFWRRWHMSLSGWFRDYVYIPLGGSRAGRARTQLNVFLVFLLSGLWHGASWTFVLWGALHGLYLVLESLTAPARTALGQRLGLPTRPGLQRALGTGSTLALVAFAWIFFRANSLPDAFYIATHLFRGWGHLPTAQLAAVVAGLGRHYVAELLVAAGAVLLLLISDYRAERGSVAAWLAGWPAAGRWAGYAGLLLAMLYFGIFGSSQFIYFQF